MTEKLEMDDTEQISTELKTQNILWVKNKWLFCTSLIFSPAAFAWGFIIPLDGIWQHWVQSIFFIVSVGFFIVPMSYLFNLVWMVSIRDRTKNKLYIGNKWLFYTSLILSPAAFAGSFFISLALVPSWYKCQSLLLPKAFAGSFFIFLDNIWLKFVQIYIYIASVIYFLISLIYLIDILWMIVAGDRKRDKLWIKNKWLFWISRIFSVAASVWAFFIPINSICVYLIQSIIFLGFISLIVFPISYLVNLVWEAYLSSRTQNKEQEN